jgi:RNA polymerase sigma-70 factor (ECF subfamily)
VLARACAGDHAAFATLVEAYYPRALRFATQLLGDAHDAEEVVQDSWLRVHDALPRFIAGAPFDPWFFRILANRCRSAQAKRGRFRALVEVGELPANAATPAAVHDDWTAEVQRALAQLPAEQREAFLLRHVEDLDYEDIAAATGVGLSAVRMRVKRACDALRLLLDEAMTHG